MDREEREIARRILWRLDYVIGLLQRLVRMEVAQMATLEDVRTKVAKVETVEQSAVVLLNELAQMVRDAADDPAEIQAIADRLESTSTALADAVTANTPAAPTP